MRDIVKCRTIQIDVTNSCVLACSNCTRFVGHRKPYMMEMDFFKRAVDSMVGFPNVVGIMGGEPLLHPRFQEMAEYACQVLGRGHVGLWTTLPKGKEYYRETIVKCFGQIFINDHSRNDIYHAPLLVAAEDVYSDRQEMWQAIDNCWVQLTWSASINPKGAFFCEVAASLALLFDGRDGWPVEPGWWKRTTDEYRGQMEEACPKCGGAVSLGRRVSTEEIDDISPSNLERLKDKSFRVKRGAFVESPLKIVDQPEEMAATTPGIGYEEFEWRQKVAAKYGITQVVQGQIGNGRDLSNEPHLIDGWQHPA